MRHHSGWYLMRGLRFKAIIKNTGTDDLNLLAPWTNRKYMSLEYRGDADPEWKQLDVPYLNRHRS
ncbi:MAG: hypothetical protein GY749_19520 [Desulfobacteraceae bacterium]|nr:hypothetical protein [Desulfobacteraceae bacterium]